MSISTSDHLQVCVQANTAAFQPEATSSSQPKAGSSNQAKGVEADDDEEGNKEDKEEELKGLRMFPCLQAISWILLAQILWARPPL